MESLAPQLDFMGIAVFGTAIALFFWLMRALGAWLTARSPGGTGESIGRAIAGLYA